MTELVMRSGVTVAISVPSPTVVELDPPAPAEVQFLPVTGPPGRDGDAASADVDPVLLFENALS